MVAAVGAAPAAREALLAKYKASLELKVFDPRLDAAFGPLLTSLTPAELADLSPVLTRMVRRQAAAALPRVRTFCAGTGRQLQTSRELAGWIGSMRPLC